MRSGTFNVTYKGVSKEVRVVLHDSQVAYQASWDRSPEALVWYEKLGMPARGHVDKEGAVHLGIPNAKLLGHEVLHLFDVHHPNKMLPALLHVVTCGFGTASFSGVFRWRDPEGILPEATRVLRLLSK